jgi:GntR family transcriptional regulator
MIFSDSKAIYLQIAELICDKILTNEWKAEEKLPSVRELAVQVEVNPNTVMRTYEFLKQQDIIFDRRGVGCFVAADGKTNALAYRKKDFLEKELPALFKTAALLGMDEAQLAEQFKQFKLQHLK